MADPVLDAHLIAERGAELRGHGTRGRHVSLDVSGAVSVPVDGIDAVTLRLVGDVTSVAFTGWTDTAELAGSGLGVGDLHQSVTVTVVQDGVGGHLLDPLTVSGDWIVSPPSANALDVSPADTSLIFSVWTSDGGATVSLDPVAQQVLDCRFVDAFEADMPDVVAGGAVVVGHQFEIVTSVELVRQAPIGRRVLADWWQQNADASAPINVDFSKAWAAGDLKIRVAGKQAEPCALVPSFTLWDATKLAMAGASTMNPTFVHDGDPGDVQIIPEDGAAPIDVVSGASVNHSFGSTGDRVATLRWRRGVSISTFTDTTTPWAFGMADLPPSLLSLTITGPQNTTSGSIGALPTGLTVYNNTGQNTTSGSIGALPTGLTFYLNAGQNTTSGDVGALPAGLTYYNNTGQNTTSGSIGALPTGLTVYNNTGQNTTSGSIGALPTGLTFYLNAGQNTTSGSIGALPTGLTYYNNTGQNTTSGSIGALPTGLTFYYNAGQNTTSGDVGALPAGLTYYYNQGQNTTSGSIGALPTGLTVYNNTGQNTTSGSIGALPTGLTVYLNAGQNTTSGSIGALPTGLTFYYNAGQNTTSGDVGALPTGLTYYLNAGQNTATYSTSYGFGSLSRLFWSEPVGGHTQGEVDQILIDLAAAGTTATAEKRVRLIGANQPPSGSAAVTQAISDLQGRGWTVETN